jgi:hypothetical protein
MARTTKKKLDADLLSAALEGLELQKKRLEEQIAEVRSLMGGGGGGRRAPRAAAAKKEAAAAAAPKRKRRQLSAAARKRIAAAQKKRWAEYRKKTEGGES